MWHLKDKGMSCLSKIRFDAKCKQKLGSSRWNHLTNSAQSFGYQSLESLKFFIIFDSTYVWYFGSYRFIKNCPAFVYILHQASFCSNNTCLYLVGPTWQKESRTIKNFRLWSDWYPKFWSMLVRSFQPHIAEKRHICNF